MKNKKVTALTMATAILGSGMPGVVCADSTISKTEISTNVLANSSVQPRTAITTKSTLDYAVQNEAGGLTIDYVRLMPTDGSTSEKEYKTIDSIKDLPFKYENGAFVQGSTIGKIKRFEFKDLGRKKVATESENTYRVFEEVKHTKADNITVKTNTDRVKYNQADGNFIIDDKDLTKVDDINEFEFQQGDVVKIAKFDSDKEEWNITDKESISVSSNTVSVNVLDLQAVNREYKLDLDSKISASTLEKIKRENGDATINVELPAGVKTDNLKEVNVRLDNIACRVKPSNKVTINIKAKQTNSSSKTLYSWVIEGQNSDNNIHKQANLALAVDNDVKNHKITIKAQDLANVSSTAIAKVNLATELDDYNSSKILGIKLDGVNRTLNNKVVDLNKSDLEKLKADNAYLQVYATTENKPEKPDEKPKPEDKVVLNDIKGHWANYEIQNFVDKGHINGYGDKTFKPDNNITRAEFIKVVNSVFGLKEKGTENFTDVSSGQWYYNDVCIAVKAGYINGYEDKTFRPNQPISREEAASIVANLKNVKGDGKLQFRDSNQVSSWAKQAVDAVSDNNLMGGYQDNTFKPKNKITRAEAVATLSRVK